MKTKILLTICVALFTQVNVLLAQTESRPNIIVVLSDDMGFSDIGCYGSEIDTPVLDSLAKDGLRFTQFYNTGRCCPTRASLLTGLYPHQTGIGHMTQDKGVDGYRGDLNQNCVTIAEALKTSGYSTYMVGKWHVTKKNQPANEADKHNWPLQRGFDKYYGIINGASSLWDPNSLVRGNKLITIKNDPEYQPDEPYHFTDAISDNAVKFIDQHDSKQPFFMYVAYTAAHWPMHARERDIEKYRGKYDQGYEPIRKRRMDKMRELGVIEKHARLSPIAGNWDNVDDKRWEAACMEVYAAMVDQMDQGIGRIVNKLKEEGALENTLICFMQDNGGCAENMGRGNKPNPRKEKPSLPPIDDDTIHYFGSAPKQTRDGWPVRQGRVMPGPADTYIAYGKGWANVSNTPHREYKHFVHEGGISTPLIVHWPSAIKDKNELRTEPTHLIDIMATCIDVSKSNYPNKHNGKKITPLQGSSLVPVFEGKQLDRDVLFWEHEGNRAIRKGDWKLVAKGRNGKWELYDVSKDRSELNDQATAHPELVEQLAELWNSKARETMVIPYPQQKKKKANKPKAERSKKKQAGSAK